MIKSKELSVRFRALVIILGLGLLSFFLAFSYVQTEITTNLYAKEIANLPEICQTANNPDFKFSKLISFEKYRQQAVLYCIYADSSKNLVQTLVYRQSWEVVSSQKLNRDGNLYWPIYL